MSIDKRQIRADVATARTSALAGLDAADRVVAAMPDVLDELEHWRRVAHELQARLDEHQQAAERSDRRAQENTAAAARPEWLPVIPPQPALAADSSRHPARIFYIRADGTPETERQYRSRLDGIRRLLRRDNANGPLKDVTAKDEDGGDG